MAFDISGIKKEIEVEGIERKNEILDCVADISKAKKLLGWEPTYDLIKGLSEMISLYKGRNN